jgi:hypothetical protein
MGMSGDILDEYQSDNSECVVQLLQSPLQQLEVVVVLSQSLPTASFPFPEMKR